MAPEKDKKEAKETKDVEMKDAEPAKPSAADVAALLLSDLKANVVLVEKSVATKETRFVFRVLRQIPSLRKKIGADDLLRLLNLYTFPAESAEAKTTLADMIKAAKESTKMEVDSSSGAADATQASAAADKPHAGPVIPEVEAYLSILSIIFLIDHKRIDDAIRASTVLVERLRTFNRRSLDALQATAMFYYARGYELSNRLAEIRSTLLAAHRTAALRHDDVGQATLLNLLLRNYLHFNLYEQADKLVSKTTFPESHNNNQYARYLYYTGRIKAIQLDYSEALKSLQQALRKAPQTSAVGFRIACTKLHAIVQLLMGEIPEKTTFLQAELKGALRPYFQLTQAVRVGDLAAFKGVMERYAALFKKDKTHTLIIRLRQNVIKTGLRKINLAYSRISFADIAHKLHLESVDDCEPIVAKAIRDGVIDAVIDHAGKFLQSRENPNVYGTHEPQGAFHKRVDFCLRLHNDAVRAMSYPDDGHRRDLESADARREREKQEQELAKNLAEGDEEDDF